VRPVELSHRAAFCFGALQVQRFPRFVSRQVFRRVRPSVRAPAAACVCVALRRVLLRPCCVRVPSSRVPSLPTPSLRIPSAS